MTTKKGRTPEDEISKHFLFCRAYLMAGLTVYFCNAAHRAHCHVDFLPPADRAVFTIYRRSDGFSFKRAVFYEGKQKSLAWPSFLLCRKSVHFFR
ncbi:hypothetical protein DI291_14265 [Bacillus paralicheniformis]|nr:hypothetical protein DI291_14265 [Bacillus paralicheniformis]